MDIHPFLWVGPAHELLSCSANITFNKYTGKGLYAKNVNQFHEKTSENGRQATRVQVWQILPFPTIGVSQQDIGGIGTVKECDFIYLDIAKAFEKVDHAILLHKFKKSELMV